MVWKAETEECERPGPDTAFWETEIEGGYFERRYFLEIRQVETAGENKYEFILYA